MGRTAARVIAARPRPATELGEIVEQWWAESMPSVRGARRSTISPDGRWVTFLSITIVFLYTSITNIFERPEGIKIASVFILSIVVMSLIPICPATKSTPWWCPPRWGFMPPRCSAGECRCRVLPVALFFAPANR